MISKCFPKMSTIKRKKTSLNARSLLLLIAASFLAACSTSPSEDHQRNNNNPSHSHGTGTEHSHDVQARPSEKTLSQINLSLFHKDTMVKNPEIVSCTLENGDQAECAKFVVKYLPDDLQIGPFCPETINDEGGIWKWDGDKEGLYRVDAAFFQMLDEQGYSFYDEDGKVHVADIATSPPKEDHACINVSIDKDVEMTLLIPTEPVMAKTPTHLGVVSKVGFTLSGVPIFSDAPSVQQTGHMPVLDTCAGHVDPGGWYHYHGTATDINTVYDHEHVDAACNQPQSSSALFGYGFDGIGIYGSTDENGKVPTDLDACHGHIGYVPGKQEKVYHYHASKDFPNLPECLSGIVAKNNFVTTAKAGIGATQSGRAEPPRPDHQQGSSQKRQGPAQGSNQGGQGQGVPPGFDTAAEKLGITTEELFQALQNAGGPRADLAQVADTLGVTEAELKAALPEPPSR